MDSLPVYNANKLFKLFQHDASNLCFSLARPFGGMSGNRTFCLFFLLLLFTSAASDHYLIGNNITVAVLGIVIPIGEYS